MKGIHGFLEIYGDRKGLYGFLEIHGEVERDLEKSLLRIGFFVYGSFSNFLIEILLFVIFLVLCAK